MSEWKSFCLGDVCIINAESYSKNDNWTFVNYLDTGNITANKIEDVQYINILEEKFPSRARRKVKTDSIIYSTVRPNQRHYGIIKSQPKNFLVSTGFAVIDVNPEIVDANFLYYRLTQDEVVQYLQSVAEQSTTAYPSIRPADVENLKFSFPSMDIQKKIVAVLSALDDKIELNNAINKNFEEQAQAIFDEFYRKADEEVFLGKTCKCELGGTPSRKNLEYWNGNISWINSGEVNKFRIIEPSEKITELGLKKSATKLLPAKTTVIAITGATLGQVSLLEIESCANQSVVGIIPNKKIPYEYIYPLVKMKISELLTHQTGGAQQHINKRNVEDLSIKILSPNFMKKYLSIVSGIYELISNICFEKQKLGELRDALLPKLMSGEIDVSAVEI